jgi:aminomethyltransferase
MKPFAGFTMPIHYTPGILAEHRHTREAAGLFDVSHMGQIRVHARSGDPADAARALETILPADVLSLATGRQRYAFWTNDSGGIRDDLMIAKLGGQFHLVVNAACTEADFHYVREQLSIACIVEALPDRSLLALQGPLAAAALSSLAPEVTAMHFMDARVLFIESADCFVTRSGYTGEDGFEISVPNAAVARIAERLLDRPSMKLIGLAARDSLRLEAGLCLYGHDISLTTTPVEANIDWAIPPVRRAGGERAGGFPGADVILAQWQQGPRRCRVGLRAEFRPVREGAEIFYDPDSTFVLGNVTSGTFGPSANSPVAMGYVAVAWLRPGTILSVDVRGKRTPVVVTELPFVPHRYRR